MNFNATLPTLNPYPTRRMIVADPGKLNFFGSAAAARFGVQNTAGSLSGLGDVDVPQNSAPATNTMKDVATIAGSFLSNLMNGTPMGSPPPPPTVSLPPDDTILGLPKMVVVIGGVAAAGFVAWKLMK